MNPITFLFSVLAPFLTLSPDGVADLKENAENWYEQSTLKAKLDQYWWVALLLPILYPIVSRYVNRFYDSIGDQNEDGDIDVDDLLALLGEKLKSNKG